MVNNLNFPHFFRVFVYLPKNAGNCKLTNKHKTKKSAGNSNCPNFVKKVQEIGR